MLDAAMALAAQWRRRGTPPPRFSVNLSALHFRDMAIAGHLSDVLMRHGRGPDTLTIELTETALLNDDPVVADCFEKIRRLGVRVALDDFGCGYSSISYLKRMRFDELKIDKSLVDELEGSEKARVLLASLVSISSALEMEMVVEGVETAQQAQILRSIGCTTAQGYHRARPMDAAAAEALLRSRVAPLSGAM